MYKNKLSKTALISAAVICSFFVSACNQQVEDVYEFETEVEMIQLFADSMASIDEIGGQSNGNITRISHPTGDQKFFARINKTDTFTARLMNDLFIPFSYAESCRSAPYYACASGKMIRAFTGCTVQGPKVNNEVTYGTLSGSIELTFTGLESATCNIPNIGETVKRIPNYSMTGLRKASFAVTAPTTGQLLTRVSLGGFFTYDNAGIVRTVRNSEGDEVFKMTTSTTSSMTVDGNARNGRTISGGGILVTDDIKNISCTFVSASPTSWNNTCNCPTTGDWTASCTDGTNMNVKFGSTCGEIMYTKGAGFKAITLDRCQP